MISVIRWTNETCIRSYLFCSCFSISSLVKFFSVISVIFVIFELWKHYVRTNHVSSNDEQRISGNRISSPNRTVHISFHLVFLKLDIPFMYFSCHNYSRKHHWWTILSPFNIIFFYISCFWFDASGIFMGKTRIDNNKVGNTVLLRKIHRV